MNWYRKAQEEEDMLVDIIPEVVSQYNHDEMLRRRDAGIFITIEEMHRLLSKTDVPACPGAEAFAKERITSHMYTEKRQFNHLAMELVVSALHGEDPGWGVGYMPPREIGFYEMLINNGWLKNKTGFEAADGVYRKMLQGRILHHSVEPEKVYLAVLEYKRIMKAMGEL